MGKSDLAIPLSDLEDYGRQLRSLKTRLNHTKKLFESYKDDIGDGSVNDALDDFESNWEDGREDITQQLDALASMSDAVVREFAAHGVERCSPPRDEPAVRPPC
jgi:hypothetical protein